MSVTDLEWYKSNSPAWENPDLKGLDVDGNRYHSKEFMDKEWKHMWPHMFPFLSLIHI